MKQINSPGWMYETSAQGWEDPEGWNGEGGGRGVGMGNTCKSMADSCQCMAKTTVIKKKKKKKGRKKAQQWP